MSLSPHQLSFSSYFFIPLSCYGSISLSLLCSLSLSHIYFNIYPSLSHIHSTACRPCTREFPHSIYPKMNQKPKKKFLKYLKSRRPNPISIQMRVHEASKSSSATLEIQLLRVFFTSKCFAYASSYILHKFTNHNCRLVHRHRRNGLQCTLQHLSPIILTN